MDSNVGYRFPIYPNIELSLDREAMLMDSSFIVSLPLSPKQPCLGFL